MPTGVQGLRQICLQNSCSSWKTSELVVQNWFWCRIGFNIEESTSVMQFISYILVFYIKVAELAILSICSFPLTEQFEGLVLKSKCVEWISSTVKSLFEIIVFCGTVDFWIFLYGIFKISCMCGNNSSVALNRKLNFGKW